jgi:hypothetical protein
MDLDKLQKFIVTAKSATYVGDGSPAQPCRPGSHDLSFEQGTFRYLDSYFGGTDFIGEEVVYKEGTPVWAMNYYGYILQPDQISGAETGAMIKASLSRMYAEGRFLGGWDHKQRDLAYHDRSEGDLTHFTGREWIEKNGEMVYELRYHGGLIKP